MNECIILDGYVANPGDLDWSALEKLELNVLSEEPPKPNHILQNLPNCLITPHQAWAARESCKPLLDIITNNVKVFLEGILKMFVVRYFSIIEKSKLSD